MLKSHEKFYSVNGKRQILIVDDEVINREVLGLVLCQEYEILYAGDGEEALRLIRSNRETLSLVLLDLMMPGMSGQELLRIQRDEPEIQRIPVIVVTADQRAEAESLTLGAIDFIPKPYPQSDIILARVRRVIELFEDREIIRSTERDELTGLYSREYFYRYAEQLDQHHRDMRMDAIVLDVNHFHMINERFGTPYGDAVLRRIGEKLREMVRDSDGIVCRREADAFMVYCPHGKDYRAILDSASVGLAGDESAGSRVRLRMGVYENVDKSLDIERRFDRAKNAADTVRSSFSRAIGFYDNTLHERELFHEQLLEDFHQALETMQFEVWFQPKYNIRTQVPTLVSAEALVRWRHPTLGLISPGVFIPLFEANGLIETLDGYVWRKTAAQIRDWKTRLGYSVPVSVNVSRIDMYDPSLIETLTQLLEEYGLEPRELLLEITESAYTQDSDQIIETVNRLRSLGFQVEMDDFGTGYSSLNMISALPIDALKLDREFLHGAFDRRRDTRMLEVIIDIAAYLSVPVIAEGVETEEQLNALKAMGCDIVQGYYFSRPVPAGEYERFLVARRDMGEQSPLPVRRPHERTDDSGYALSYGKVAYALSSGYESIYYVDLNNDHYVEFSSQGKYEDLKIENNGTDFFADTLRNIPRVVYAEDQARVAKELSKEALLSNIPGMEPHSILYRLVIGGTPMYYSLKAVRAGSYDRHHLVIGVRNVDGEIRNARRIGEQSGFTPDFTGLAKALSRDIESVYYVDLETGEYLGYASDGAYGLLLMDNSGGDFFDSCQRDIQKTVYSEDWEKVANALDRKTLLAALGSRKSFSMDYRLVIEDQPRYYRMKVIPAETGRFRHIIVGVSNVDAQITEEQRISAERQNLQSSSRIAQALAQDYFSIYYVDVETDYFIEYSADDSFSAIGIEKRGDDFFTLSRRNIRRLIYEKDLPAFLEVFTKENILRELDARGSFSITYRMLLNGEPKYVMMKASRLDGRHIVIGTSNVNAEVQQRKTALVNSGIAEALSSDYFLIFYVDTETDHYIVYRSIDPEQETADGENFFEVSRKNLIPNINQDDIPRVDPLLEKETMLQLLAESGSYTVDYRLMMDGKPTYVHMKASRMADREDHHIVIGLRNIDAQIRREQEQARALQRVRELVGRDALTNVKSKRAFVEAEQQWDEWIKMDPEFSLAVAVFDINGLKEINDSLGHAAGDEYIRAASAAICEVFQHSPVYRIGGDEFAAILTDRDYDKRAALEESFLSANAARAAGGGVVVACGISEYLPGLDNCFQDVFERADALMYEEKKRLKEKAN